MSEALWLIEGTMAKAERDAIVAALKASDYHLTATAARLKIGRSTLYRLIATYQIPVESADPDRPTARRSRQGRPLKKKSGPDTRRSVGVSADEPRIIQVNGAWYLLNPAERPSSKS